MFCALLLLISPSYLQVEQSPGPKATPSEKLKQFTLVMRTAADVMASVKDAASANKAVVDLKTLRSEAIKYWTMSQKLADSSEDVDKALEEKARAASRDFFVQASAIKSQPSGVSVRREVQALYLAMNRGVDSKEELPWRWSEEKASIDYCAKTHLPDFDVKLQFEKQYYTPVEIRNKDGKSVYKCNDANGSFQSHRSIVFARWKNIIFITDFCPISTGCTIVAVNLESGKEIWRNRLFGTGPTPRLHSKYSNSINIETDGKRVIVFGKESDGMYVEHLDINTGKTIANQRYEHDWVGK